MTAVEFVDLGPRPATRLRVLAALMGLEASGAKVTVHTVAAEAGVAVGTAHAHLRALDEAGVIMFPEGTRGVLRSGLGVAR